MAQLCCQRARRACRRGSQTGSRPRRKRRLTAFQVHQLSTFRVSRAVCISASVGAVVVEAVDAAISADNFGYIYALWLTFAIIMVLSTAITAWLQIKRARWVWCRSAPVVSLAGLSYLAILSAHDAGDHMARIAFGLMPMIFSPLLFHGFASAEAVGIGFFIILPAMTAFRIDDSLSIRPQFLRWTALLAGVATMIVYVLFAVAAKVFRAEQAHTFDRTKKLFMDEMQYTALLERMLPARVLDHLLNGMMPVADTKPDVSVLFCQIIDDVDAATTSHLIKYIHLMGKLFEEFDERVMLRQAYKVLTFGTEYVAVSGVPAELDHPPNATQALCYLAQDLLKVVDIVNRLSTIKLQAKIGIHTGPVIEAVVGDKMPRWSIFGDAVNTASRMKSTADAGSIQLSEAAFLAIGGQLSDHENGPNVSLPCGLTIGPPALKHVKGKGFMTAYPLLPRIQALRASLPTAMMLPGSPSKPQSDFGQGYHMRARRQSGVDTLAVSHRSRRREVEDFRSSLRSRSKSILDIYESSPDALEAHISPASVDGAELAGFHDEHIVEVVDSDSSESDTGSDTRDHSTRHSRVSSTTAPDALLPPVRSFRARSTASESAGHQRLQELKESLVELSRFEDPFSTHSDQDDQTPPLRRGSGAMGRSFQSKSSFDNPMRGSKSTQHDRTAPKREGSWYQRSRRSAGRTSHDDALLMDFAGRHKSALRAGLTEIRQLAKSSRHSASFRQVKDDPVLPNRVSLQSFRNSIVLDSAIPPLSIPKQGDAVPFKVRRNSCPGRTMGIAQAPKRETSSISVVSKDVDRSEVSRVPSEQTKERMKRPMKMAVGVNAIDQGRTLRRFQSVRIPRQAVSKQHKRALVGDKTPQQQLLEDLRHSAHRTRALGNFDNHRAKRLRPVLPSSQARTGFSPRSPGSPTKPRARSIRYSSSSTEMNDSAELHELRRSAASTPRTPTTGCFGRASRRQSTASVGSTPGGQSSLEMRRLSSNQSVLTSLKEDTVHVDELDALRATRRGPSRCISSILELWQRVWKSTILGFPDEELENSFIVRNALRPRLYRIVTGAAFLAHLGLTAAVCACAFLVDTGESTEQGTLFSTILYWALAKTVICIIVWLSFNAAPQSPRPKASVQAASGAMAAPTQAELAAKIQKAQRANLTVSIFQAISCVVLSAVFGYRLQQRLSDPNSIGHYFAMALLPGGMIALFEQEIVAVTTLLLHLPNKYAFGSHATQVICFSIVMSIFNTWDLALALGNIFGGTILGTMQYVSETTRREAFVVQRTSTQEKDRCKALLQSMMPEVVSEVLVRQPTDYSSSKLLSGQLYTSVSMLFLDIVGFTSLSATATPATIAEMLSELFAEFDSVVAQHNALKVETIGDAYFVAAGVPDRNDIHAETMAKIATEFIRIVDGFRFAGLPRIQVRIGLHSGRVVAGVIGYWMPRFHLFGKAVEKTMKMESSSEPGMIRISRCIHELLSARNRVHESRGSFCSGGSESARGMRRIPSHQPPLYTFTEKGTGSGTARFLRTAASLQTLSRVESRHEQPRETPRATLSSETLHMLAMV